MLKTYHDNVRCLDLQEIMFMFLIFLLTFIFSIDLQSLEELIIYNSVNLTIAKVVIQMIEEEKNGVMLK